MLSFLKNLVPRRAKLAARRVTRNLSDSLRYRLLRHGARKEGGRHLVFICKGNICRSAFAERYFRRRADCRLTIESCGLDVDRGTPSPAEAVSAAAALGVDLAGHRSRGLKECDIRRADLILPMEYSQYRRLVALYPEKKDEIRLLRDFLPGPSGLFCNIDDPFGSDAEEYEDCFRLMMKALSHLENRLGRMYG